MAPPARRLFAPFLLIAAVALAGGAGAAPDAAAQQSLYERLGGKDAITAVVERFTADQLADPRLAKRYTNTDIAAWRGHIVDLICSATGGPCEYTGRAMNKAHARQYISEDEFGWTAGHLVAALDHFNVPQAEKDELVAIAASLKDQIVGQ